MLPERCCTCLFLAATLPTRPRLSGCIQLNGPRRLVVAGAGRLLREQVVLARGWCVFVGVRNAVGSWNIVFQDPTARGLAPGPCGFRGQTWSVLWRCPTLPHPPRCSTIGACGLSFQVRNGGWAFPRGYDHHKLVQPYSLESPPVCAARQACVWGFVLVVIRIVATSTL